MRGYGREDSLHRTRDGLVVLMIGLAVLLAAVGMAILRAPSPTGDGAPGGDDLRPNNRAEPAAAQAGVVLSVLAGLALVLVVTLLVVAYALFRLTRRLAVPEANADKHAPTPTDDVWRMHKPPDIPLDDQPDKPGEAGQN